MCGSPRTPNRRKHQEALTVVKAKDIITVVKAQEALRDEKPQQY